MKGIWPWPLSPEICFSMQFLQDEFPDWELVMLSEIKYNRSWIKQVNNTFVICTNNFYYMHEFPNQIVSLMFFNDSAGLFYTVKPAIMSTWF